MNLNIKNTKNEINIENAKRLLTCSFCIEINRTNLNMIDHVLPCGDGICGECLIDKNLEDFICVKCNYKINDYNMIRQLFLT